MKKIVLSLLALGLVVLGVVGVGTSFLVRGRGREGWASQH